MFNDKQVNSMDFFARQDQLSAVYQKEVPEEFYEACSALYNDIIDALDHNQEVNESEFVRRQMMLVENGNQLSETIPQLSTIISSKLNTLNRAMEHLRINRQSILDAPGKDDHEPTALNQLRKWVQQISEQIKMIETNISQARVARKMLERLAADQQVLQLQIETEGRSLVESVQRTVRYLNLQEELPERCERHLKTLTQRWYHLWLRSLSVQCRIEHLLNHQHSQSDDEIERDCELCEPQQKRRRFNDADRNLSDNEQQQQQKQLSVSKQCLEDKDWFSSQEDTIPFAADEYESIKVSTEMLKSEVETDRRVQSIMTASKNNDALSSAEDEGDNQRDIGYSSGHNSFHEAVHSNQEIMHANADASNNNGRLLRIHSSPVKSFYKTVPLDDTGATDTETPRAPAAWDTAKATAKNGMQSGVDLQAQLSDSLIVHPDETSEFDANDNIEEILLMLDEKSGNHSELLPNMQGTRWREFRSGKLACNQIPFAQLLAGAIENDLHSRDASSEASDDMEIDECQLTKANLFTTPPSHANLQNSLKRRRKQRTTSVMLAPPPSTHMHSSAYAIENEMSASVCSTGSRMTCYSELAYQNDILPHSCTQKPRLHCCSCGGSKRRTGRRKLRARRLPRSMSDGEQLLGFGMSASTYSAPGGANLLMSFSMCDSDTTALEQSDAAPYEWDDYNPPAKAEDDWENEDADDMSILTIEDDFQMQLGTPYNAIAMGLRVNGQCTNDRRQGYRDNLEQTLISRRERPVGMVRGKIASSTIAADNGWNHEQFMKVNDIDHAEDDDDRRLRTDSINTRTSSSTDSSLSLILPKIKQFADSLKLVQDDCNSSSSSLSSIRSLDDVVSILKKITEIHEQLLNGQHEFQRLQSSESSSSFVSEYQPTVDSYVKAIEHVEHLRNRIEEIHKHWNDWAETQGNMKTLMHDIENELVLMRKGGNNSQQICSELELCQERMNRLETVCNYLTSNFPMVNDNVLGVPTVDFASELELYSNAFNQLKTKFERQCSTVDKGTWVHTKRSTQNCKRKSTTTTSTSTSEHQPKTSLASSQYTLWALLALAVLAALAACLATSDAAWRTTLGPHLQYVDGPPPV